jgi:hypothetical protein
MNKKTIVAASIVVVALSGCAQMGMFAAGNVTNVQLSAPNYEIVAVGVSGSAKASYLLGVTYSNGPQTGSVALARIGGRTNVQGSDGESLEGL